MVLRLLAPLLASAWLGRGVVLRGNDAEPEKVHYDVHLGPGKLSCKSAVALFAGAVDSRHECEAKCSAEAACSFYHVFPGNQHWCRTSTSCDGFTKESVDGIVIYAKRGKARAAGSFEQAPDAVEPSHAKAPDTVESSDAKVEKVAKEEEEEEEDLITDAMVKSSVQQKAVAGLAPLQKAATEEQSTTFSPKPGVPLKAPSEANMTAKEKLKGDKKAQKKALEAEKKKLKAAKAEKKKLEAEKKARAAKKKKEEKEKIKAAKKKAGRTLMMLQEQVSTTPPIFEKVEVNDVANPFTAAPAPKPPTQIPVPAPTAVTDSPTLASPTGYPTYHPTSSPTWNPDIVWHPTETPTMEPPSYPPTPSPTPPSRATNTTGMVVRGCLPHNGTNLRPYNGSWRIGNKMNQSLDAFHVGHGLYWFLRVPEDHPVNIKVVGENEFGMADPLSNPLKSHASDGTDPDDHSKDDRYFGCHAIIRNGTTPNAPGSMEHRYNNFTVEFWGRCHEGQTFDIMCYEETSHGIGRLVFSGRCDPGDHMMDDADMSDGGVDEIQESMYGNTVAEWQAAADEGHAYVPTYERKKRQTPKNLHLWACPELSTTSGRCGPYYGRCNDELDRWAKYCNEKTYWCGNTEEMRVQQSSDYWDASPKEDCIIAPEASWKDAALYTNSQFPDRPYRKPKRHLFGKLPEYDDEEEEVGNATNATTTNRTKSTLMTRRR